MGMSTEDALNYFKNRTNAENEEANKAPENNVETKVDEPKSNEESTTETETSKVEVKEDNKDGESKVEDKVESPKADEKTKDETKDSSGEKKDTPKPKPTKQQQIDYAFAKVKAKNRKLEQRIRSLEEEIRNSKPKTQADFGDKMDEYINYLVEKKSKETELERSKQEYADNRSSEYEQINEQRMSDCFPDPVEKQKYLDLVKSSGKEFLAELDSSDPEGVVLGYLDDSDIAPLIIRVMMTSDQYKNDVLSKSSPWARAIALDKLASGIRFAKEKLAEQSNTQHETVAVQPKQTMPVVGKVTNSDAGTGNVVPNWQDRLRKLNQSRGRY